MALPEATFTYKILTKTGDNLFDGPYEEETITESKVVLPPTKSVFSPWDICPICASPFPTKEMIRYNGKLYCPDCVNEEIEEDQKKGGR